MKVRVPAIAGALASKVQEHATIFDRGLVIDTPHIVADRQPDGRLRLTLHPDVLGRLEALEAKVGV